MNTENLLNRKPELAVGYDDLLKRSVRATTEQAKLGVDPELIITPKTLHEVLESSNVGGGGTTTINNVFKTGSIPGSYTADIVTNIFTVANIDKNKEVQLIFNNLVLVEGSNYTLDKTTGQVTLNFNLEVGETIHYSIASTGYEYKALANTPEEHCTIPVDIEYIEGRTLVNLLGRAGNPIYQQDLFAKYDKVRLKVDYIDTECIITATEENLSRDRHMSIQCPIRPNKCYILISDKTDNGIETEVSLETAIQFIERHQTFVTKNHMMCAMKIKPDAKDSNARVLIRYFGEAINAELGKLKDIRYYEISEEIFNKIEVDPEYSRDKLIEKYPYVDDIKCVANPYFENIENLLAESTVRMGSYKSTGEIGERLNSNTKMCIHRIKIKPNTQYTFTIDKELDLFTGGWIALFNGNNLVHQELFDKSVQSLTFNSSTATEFVFDIRNEVNGSTISKFTDDKLVRFSGHKFTLTVGNESKSYAQCNNSRLVLETKLYEGERITKDIDGNYIKTSEWEEIEITDNIMTTASKSADMLHTQINISNITYPTNSATDPAVSKENFMLVRYDGKVMYTHVDQPDHAWGNHESFHLGGSRNNSTNMLILMIPNTLSGWGPTYIPTIDEIKAFFLGYRMSGIKNNGGDWGNLYDPASHSSKCWAKMWCGIDSKASVTSTLPLCDVVKGTHTDIVPKDINELGYTPYRVIYKKYIPNRVIINTVGILDAKNCDNITVGGGFISTESSIHSFGFNTGKYFLNDEVCTLQKLTSYRNNRVVSVYRGDDIMILDRYPVMNYWVINEGTEQVVVLPQKYLPPNTKVVVHYLAYYADHVNQFNYKLSIPNKEEILTHTITRLSDSVAQLLNHNIRLTSQLNHMYQSHHNDNILINGDFQVWQRGETFTNVTTPRGYVSDMWYRWCAKGEENHPCTISKIDKGISITTPDNRDVFGLASIIPNHKYLLGKTVTVSANVLRCVRTAKIQIFDSLNVDKVVSTIKEFEIGMGHSEFTFTIPKALRSKYLIISISTASDVDLEYVKLELGDRSTDCCHRDYGQELALCQRYFERIGNNISPVLGSPVQGTGGKYYTILIPFNVSKPSTYSVVFSDTSQYRIFCRDSNVPANTWIFNVVELHCEQVTNTSMLVSFTSDSAINTGTICYLQRADAATKAWIDVDASVY